MNWLRRSRKPSESSLPSPVAVIDVETTGLYPDHNDRILEIAVVALDANGDVEATFETLVNPRRDPGPVSIHGISARDLVDAPEFGDIAGHIADILSDRVVAAHNASFDIRFLGAEFRRIGAPLPQVATCCTIRYARQLIDAPNYRLATVCQVCGIPLKDYHSAAADAEAASHLLRHLWLRKPSRSVFHSVLELNDLGGSSWPRLPASGRALPRTAARAIPRPALSQLLDSVPISLPPSSDGHLYLDLLARVLEDRRLTEEELTALREAAREFGLDRHTLEHLHEQYLRQVIRAVWADGRLSNAERQDVELLASLLGFSNEQVGVWLRDGQKGSGRSMLSQERSSESLVGKQVCFTGESKLTYRGEPLTRALAESLASQAGLVVKPSVTRRVDFLVCADPYSESGKARRARELGVRIVAEEEFWRWLGLEID